MTVPKFEWSFNFNTVLQIFTLGGLVAGWIYIWANTERDIDELQAWKISHELLHKERLADVKAIEARQDERVKGIESDVRKLSAVTDNLSYRITTNEQAVSSTTQTVGKVQDTLSQLGGDVRLVMEILQRMEAAQKKGH